MSSISDSLRLFSGHGEKIGIGESVRPFEIVQESPDFFLGFIVTAESSRQTRPGDFKLQFPLVENLGINFSRDQVIAFNLYLKVFEACIAAHPEELPAYEGIKAGFRKTLHDAVNGF